MAEVTIPDMGLTAILNLIDAGLFMAVGSGLSDPAATDTTLEAEFARVAISSYTIVPATRIEYQAYFTAAQVGGQTIHKVGVFDAASGGSLICQKLATLVVPAGQGCVASMIVPVGRQ